jgi:RNA polymerase sigma factor (sigma-70 family)
MIISPVVPTIASLPEFDGKTIIDRILAGDPAAEEELIERFQQRVRLYVAVRTSHPDYADEVTQETMLAAVVALREGKVREPDRLAAFILGIARNQLADAIRKQARRKTAPWPDGYDCPAPNQVQDPELVESARIEIETLEPGDRRILWLTLIDGFKPGEIAVQVGMSAELVRQRKSRALRKIVERLQPLSRSPRDLRLTGKA